MFTASDDEKKDPVRRRVYTEVLASFFLVLHQQETAFAGPSHYRPRARTVRRRRDSSRDNQ